MGKTIFVPLFISSCHWQYRLKTHENSDNAVMIAVMHGHFFIQMFLALCNVTKMCINWNKL